MADLAASTELARLPDRAMISLRGDALDPAFARAAGGVMGALLPTRANTVSTAAGWTIAWLGPDEWLLMAEHDEDAATTASRLDTALAGHHAAVTDVSGARVVLRLAGPRARDVLAGGCSLDLDPPAFPVGACAGTLLARATVIVICRDAAPTFDILPRRSFAHYLHAWLEDPLAR